MELHLIGSNGFIGKAIQEKFVGSIKCWSSTPAFDDEYFDVLNPNTWKPLLSGSLDCVIILSWPGLPRYSETFHLTRNLPACVKLVEALAEAKCEHIIVAGTCYEYGMQEGPLAETLVPIPCNQYALAKDTFRKALELICYKSGARWTWFRIFYPYGKSQNRNSLYPSLLRAIQAQDPVFNLGSRDKIRDFLQVENVAQSFVNAISSNTQNGIVNLGSGKPQTLECFVKSICNQFKSSIELNWDYYPNRDDEPLQFWANIDKAKFLNLI